MTIPPLFPCLIRRHPGLLFLHMSNELNRVASPDLHGWYDSSGWDDAVGGDDGAVFDYCTLENDGVVADVGFFFEDAWVEGAAVLDHAIVLDL